MPYKLQGSTVVKDTGEVVKRHKTRKQALAHLAALVLNVTETYTPPQAVQATARQGLELRQKYGRGGLTTQQAGDQGIGSGVARAATLANGKAVSPKVIKQMVAFFARHEKNKNTPPEEGNGKIAWQLWGGDAGKAWANKVKAEMDGAQEAERDYKKEYDTYQGKPDQIKKRASRNKARRLMIAKGPTRMGDGKDVDHKNSNPLDNSAKNLRVISKSKNRAMNEAIHLSEAGARNSQIDQKRIQAAHDVLCELGAVCDSRNARMMIPEALRLTPRQYEAIRRYLESK